jgi:hypothetical protein
MEQIFQILETIGKVFIVSWFITRFKPLTWVLELLPDKLAFNMVKLLLTCSICSAFWISLLLTQDIFFSAFMSYIMMAYEKTIGAWENRIRLN